MLYLTVPFNEKYDRIEHLPRWAYHKDEWKQIISSSDKIINGIMYKKKSVSSDSFDYSKLMYEQDNNHEQ